MFHSAQFIESVKKYCPEVFEAFQTENIEERFSKTPAISVDYGLIEKMERIFCVPIGNEMKWNDLGDFSTFYDKYHTKQDDRGNVYLNKEIMLDCANNMVYSEEDKAIAMIGVSDIVVIDQKDALLICHRDETQKVKDVVNILKMRNDSRH
jgi:mannose-1-phosphate guanylyltransferase/mannose-6-phosphate isomerase